ncbi:MAG: hypothetical protein ACYTGC_05160 [Planctomycetota bacterium]|jgi:hypothetical protein
MTVLPSTLRSSLIATLLIAIAWPESTLAADRVRSVVERPVAVRGGVLMLPLTKDRPGDWPSTVRLVLDGGRRLEGHVAWVHAVERGPSSGWTEDPRGLAVRAVRSDDGVGNGAPGAPYLLARLPLDGEGPIRLDRQTLQPTWYDAPARGRRTAAPPDLAPTVALPTRSAPDRPDRRSPFEYWRLVLLAETVGEPVPPPDDPDGLAAMVAEHQADLWRMGLTRLEGISPALAERCRDLLTRVCVDRGQTFAAWVVDTEQLASLLTLLLDRGSSSESTRSAVEAWVELQQPLLMWLESEDPQQIHLAIVNRSHDPIIATFAWPGRDDIPIAVELRPGELTTVTIDRPPRPPATFGRARVDEPEVLRIEVSPQVFNLPVGPRRLVARPPAAFRYRLRRPLTLAEVQTATLLPEPADHAAVVHLRRRQGRWELFFDCRRRGGPIGATRLGAVDRSGLSVGSEAVTILLGSGDDAVHLVIPEAGAWALLEGARDVALEVHRRSLSDRWLCRVVLPPQWLAGDEIELACARTFGGEEGFQTAPGAGTPWRPAIGRVAIDLSHWADLPAFEEKRGREPFQSSRP